MIVFTGCGVLVPVLYLVCWFALEAASRAVTGSNAYYYAHGWPRFLALVASAFLVWGVARLLDRRPGWQVVDKATGKQHTIKHYDTFFVVRMSYWAAILAAAGLYNLVFA